MSFATVAGIILFLVLVLVVAAVVVYRTRLSPKAKEREARRLHAIEMYEASRGTLHLQTVRACLPALRSATDGAERELRDLQNEKKLLEAKYISDCRCAIGLQLMRRELCDVPEIGDNLATAIERQIFRSGVEDLRHASRLDGIGPARQAALNKWVRSVERRMPALRQESYPNKTKLAREHVRRAQDLTAKIDQARSRFAHLGDTLQHANAAGAWLGAITADDYAQALVDTSHKRDRLVTHELGVFAEWQAMPEWFKHMQEVARR